MRDFLGCFTTFPEMVRLTRNIFLFFFSNASSDSYPPTCEHTVFRRRCVAHNHRSCDLLLFSFFAILFRHVLDVLVDASFRNFPGSIPGATEADVQLAVAAAKDAFYRNKGQDWPKTTGAHRSKFMRAIAAKARGTFWGVIFVESPFFHAMIAFVHVSDISHCHMSNVHDLHCSYFNI